VLAAGYSHNGFRLWDLATGKAREPSPESAGYVTHLAFSHDGAVLAAAGDHRLKHAAKSAPHETVDLWSVQTGRQLAILDSGWGVRSLRFLPDGKTLAIAREAGRASGARQLGTAEVQIWDLATFQQQKRLGGFPSWDRSALKVFLRNVRCGGVSGFGMSLSPDGRRLATSELEKVAISDVATGATTLLGTHPVAVFSLVFSHDSQTLATLAEGYGIADGEARAVRLWDLASRKQIAVLNHPGQRVSEIAFSPDGQLIATATFSSVGLYLWKLSGYDSAATKSHGSSD
jgi:WD40 repeat protein